MYPGATARNPYNANHRPCMKTVADAQGREIDLQGLLNKAFASNQK